MHDMDRLNEALEYLWDRWETEHSQTDLEEWIKVMEAKYRMLLMIQQSAPSKSRGWLGVFR